MKRNTCLYLLLAGLLFSMPATAQRRTHKEPKKPAQKEAPKPQPITMKRSGDDTTIRSTTLEVYQVYKPEIKPTPKQEFTPTLPPADAQRVPQQYEVPQQALYYTYRSLPLKPLALGKDTTTPPSQNYIKAGGGNLSTIYVDAGIGSLRGRDWESAIHAQHISQRGNIEGQKFWYTGLDATGTLHRNGHAWSGGLDADYRRVGLYGYDHDLYPTTGNPFQKVFAGAGLQFGVQNEGAGVLGLDYHPVIKVSALSGSDINGEETIDLKVPVSKRIDTSLTAEFGVQGIFTHLNAANYSMGNNIFQLTPAVSFQREQFKGHFGLSPTFGRGGVAYLLPDITAAYSFSTSFLVKAGWQAQLTQNTYQQLSLKNPFLAAPDTIRQTRSDEVFIDAAAGIGSHFSISGRFSWWQYNSLPMYRTSMIQPGNTFDVIYDPKVNAISLQIAARYQIGETFSLGVSGAWYNYYKKTYDHVYQEPGIRLKGDLQWCILKDFQFNAYTSLLDEIYARNPLGEDVKLNGVLDVGIGAEYQVIPKLSFWLNIGNLLDRRNERWLGYRDYGINIFGGLRFRF